MSNVGEKIRETRKAKGLTQKELGELCGIAEPTIRRYETGKLNPKFETIEKIANALGVTWSYLKIPAELLVESSIDSAVNYVQRLQKKDISPARAELLSMIDTMDEKELSLFLDLVKSIKQHNSDTTEANNGEYQED